MNMIYTSDKKLVLPSLKANCIHTVCIREKPPVSYHDDYEEDLKGMLL